MWLQKFTWIISLKTAIMLFVITFGKWTMVLWNTHSTHNVEAFFKTLLISFVFVTLWMSSAWFVVNKITTNTKSNFFTEDQIFSFWMGLILWGTTGLLGAATANVFANSQTLEHITTLMMISLSPMVIGIFLVFLMGKNLHINELIKWC